jgi:7-cyano-7-deazaguanine synthase in queuosine biosynthesis
MHLYNIDEVEIPFDIKWNNIAISISGGADSALLAYLLCSLNKNSTVHVISHIRMWKTKPWQQWDSIHVYNWLTTHFPNIKFKRYTNLIAPEIEYGNIGPSLIDEYGKKVSGDNIQQRAYAEYVCYQNNIDAYYNAVTRNPKLAHFNGMGERDIDRTPENEHLRIMKHMGMWAIHPFRFVDKSWVIKQYKRLDIWNLLELTRSCEGEVAGINYTSYTPGQYVPTCGTCFWCKEREWAIESTKSSE